MVTMIDSVSVDATAFVCWACAFAILDDWAVTEDPEVPGWIVEWLE